MSAALDRAILRESARLRAAAQDCRSRITRIAALTALLRRSVTRSLAALREPPVRPGEVRVPGLDGAALAAWVGVVLVCVGALLVAAVGAAVIGAALP